MFLLVEVELKYTPQTISVVYQKYIKNTSKVHKKCIKNSTIFYIMLEARESHMYIQYYTDSL